MAEHVGYICKVDKIIPHTNADRLNIAIIFDTPVVVDLTVQAGDIGVYFPIDLQLSEEYCAVNNLVRKKDENGKNIGGYLDPAKRNIRAMKLRGERSEGLYMPLSSLAYTGVTKFEVGETISILNGHEICQKYIPRTNRASGGHDRTNIGKRRKVNISPLFAEHVETEQLVYHMDMFRPEDQIEITLKMHGTSGRTGYLPRIIGYKHKNLFYNHWLQKDPNTLGKHGRKWHFKALETATPIYDWGYVTGSRHKIINDVNPECGWYGDDSFRLKHTDTFKGKLHKGETVYYEIVGFLPNGTPIMPSVSNKKISDSEFIKEYGDTTVFSYGCEPSGMKTMYGKDEHGDFALPVETPQSDIYVYRMTMTNEDGDTVEYTPDYMRYRCDQMGVKTVPVFWKGYIPEKMEHIIDFMTDEQWDETPGEWVRKLSEFFYDGPDPIGKTHVREGVVIRIVNRPVFTALKHKNFSFKVLSGIAADLAAEDNSTEGMDEDRLAEL